MLSSLSFVYCINMRIKVQISDYTLVLLVFFPYSIRVHIIVIGDLFKMFKASFQNEIYDSNATVNIYN